MAGGEAVSVGTKDGANGTNVGTNTGTNESSLILDCLRADSSLTLDALADRVSVSRRTVARILDQLKKDGRLLRVGGTRGRWEVLGEVLTYAPPAQPPRSV